MSNERDRGTYAEFGTEYNGMRVSADGSGLVFDAWHDGCAVAHDDCGPPSLSWEHIDRLRAKTVTAFYGTIVALDFEDTDATMVQVSVPARKTPPLGKQRVRVEVLNRPPAEESER